MRRVISKLSKMSDTGKFSTPIDDDVASSLNALSFLVERMGWDASIDDSVMDGLTGSEFSMVLFEIASCLEERGDVSSIFLSYIMRGLAMDQDLSETKNIPTNTVWVYEVVPEGNMIEWDIDGGLVVECPKCRCDMSNISPRRFLDGVACDCGAIIKIRAISVRFVAEDV